MRGPPVLPRYPVNAVPGDTIVTSPLSPPLDLDQVAAVLAGLRPGWREQGLVVRPFLWRDARGSWPQILHTDRGEVAEPESVGLTLTAADGREASLVIWRGGWADVGLLAGGAGTTRHPGGRQLDGPGSAPPRARGGAPTGSTSDRSPSSGSPTGGTARSRAWPPTRAATAGS